MVERIAPQVINEKRKIYKGVSANIDFFSGFVYNMLDLPEELYTPMFAIARIVGWSAHRIEELVNAQKSCAPPIKKCPAIANISILNQGRAKQQGGRSLLFLFCSKS